MKTWMQWTIGAALVAAAWGVAALTPPEDAGEASFPVQASIGEQVQGRNIQATITGVHRAKRVEAGDWSASGNWLVVDLSAAAVTDGTAAALAHVSYTIDGVEYTASERPDSLRGGRVWPGIPRSGSIAFELPADLTAGRGTLTLGLRSDTRLDSVIALDIELGALRALPTVTLETTRWAHG